MDIIQRDEWGRRAEAFLDAALDDMRSGVDAIPNVSAAEASLRIESYEMPPDDDLKALGNELLGVGGEDRCTCNFGHTPYYLSCPLNAGTT